MSLVKLDKNGRIRESWVNKKSIKRLEIIYRKLVNNARYLHTTGWMLKQYNLDSTDILLLGGRYTELAIKFKFYINKRKRNQL